MTDPNILSQYQNAKKFGGVFDFSYRGKIEVVGADRISFLHRMLTNEIASLMPGQGCYATLLTAQSKIISDMNVLVFENHALLTVEPCATQNVIASLQKFVVMDDVGFKDQTEMISVISVFGGEAETVVKKITGQNTIPNRLFFHQPISICNILCELVRIPFYGMTAWAFLVPIQFKQEFDRALLTVSESQNVFSISHEAKEMFRIEAGVPTFGVDFDETTLLLETGIESRAVSFTKGCYPGQELVARMDSRAKFAKKLALLELTEDLIPGAGSLVLKNSKEIGKITSVCFSPKIQKPIAFSFVPREYYVKDETVEIVISPSQIVKARLLF